MSKMDGLRAMREAGYERAMARAAQRAAAATGSQPLAGGPVAAESSPTAPSPPPTAGSCGHRSINGRTCTREQGHAAKSHRYS